MKKLSMVLLFVGLILGLMFAPVQRVHAMLTSVGLDKSQYTSDFMIGNVVVSIVFVESDGSQDPNTENWSDERRTQVISEIMSGLDWWTKQNPTVPLSFTFVSQTVTTRYEPITRPYYDEALWIPEIMQKIGYSGSRFSSTRSYDNDLREQYNSDWAYTIFVVDSLNDSNGKFSDGFFAYAYLGGPFMVMTYDNNGYGISNMDVVVAHETGHIFNALDEYAGASSPSSYSPGYFPTINGNHAYSSTANEPNSIMRGGIRWGLDSWAREMIGWRDKNNNNRCDIIDENPSTNVAQVPIGSSGGGNSAFNGQAKVKVAARQGNVQGYGLTVDTIKKVECRYGSGSWSDATAVDGAFDSADEPFHIQVQSPTGASAQSTISSTDLEIRVTTAFSSWAGASSGGSSAGLDNAHAYPNPFKPNSNLGHSIVTFSGITAGAKIQVFTPAGEPLYDGTVPEGSTSLPWAAVDDDGNSLGSGVYYYLITNSSGEKKKGSLAIIR